MKIWERFTCRAPCGARRYGQRSHGVLLMIFQPTRPLRGATCRLTPYRSCIAMISTHAPLAGRDNVLELVGALCGYFNPRAPCGARPQRSNMPNEALQISTHAPLAGRDRKRRRDNFPDTKFQPTRPLRGATILLLVDGMHARDFNPRAPCGARQPTTRSSLFAVYISTHAPLAGRDEAQIRASTKYNHFNPRAPCGARRSCRKIRLRGHSISTHAPLAGRDACGRSRGRCEKIFQPTRPLRGAT